MRFAIRSIASLVATALVGATMPVVPAHANVIGTEDVVAAESLRIDREALHGMLDRDDVRAQLSRPAFSRVSALNIRYVPYSSLREHRESIARFGSGLKPIEAIARQL